MAYYSNVYASSLILFSSLYFALCIISNVNNKSLHFIYRINIFRSLHLSHSTAQTSHVEIYNKMLKNKYVKSWMVNMTTRPTRLTAKRKHLYSKDMNQNNQSTMFKLFMRCKNHLL